MTEPGHHQRPDSWGSTATSYEAMFMPFSQGAAKEALRAAAVGPGDRFLDIAAGTGALTLEAAARGAEVVAIDFAEGMLTLLQDKLAGAEVAGVETHVMDGQSLEFEDGSFDVAGSNFGLIFFPDLAKGLLELHRVLRSGGRGFVTSMANPQQAPLMKLVMGAVMRAAPGFRPESPPATIELSTPETMREALTAAGFRDVRVEALSAPWPVPDAGEFWDRWVIDAPPTAAMMSGLSENERAAGRDSFSDLVAEHLGGAEANFPTNIIIGVGTKGSM